MVDFRLDNKANKQTHTSAMVRKLVSTYKDMNELAKKAWHL